MGYYTADHDENVQAKFMLNDMCLDYRWKNIVNTDKHIAYEKVTDETVFVEIIVSDKDGGRGELVSVSVSVPVKNSIIQYKTRFGNFTDACRYVEERITDYEEEDL